MNAKFRWHCIFVWSLILSLKQTEHIIYGWLSSAVHVLFNFKCMLIA